MDGVITALIVGAGLVAGAFVAVIFGKQLVRRLQVSQDDRDRIVAAWSCIAAFSAALRRMALHYTGSL